MTTILVFVMAITACVSPKRRKESNFFADFNVLKRRGIIKLSDIDVVERMRHKLIVYHLVYNASRLDSVIIFNPYKSSEPMRLSVVYNDSICVYETVYPYWGGLSYKSYYVVGPLKLDQYIELQDGWDVRTIKENKSFGRLKIAVNDNDTIGFRNKLLRSEPLNLRNMPAHDLHIYNNRLSNNFTFTNWLTYDVLK